MTQLISPHYLASEVDNDTAYLPSLSGLEGGHSLSPLIICPQKWTMLISPHYLASEVDTAYQIEAKRKKILTYMYIQIGHEKIMLNINSGLRPKSLLLN